MKTTWIIRNVANPQRTTLAHLRDTAELLPREREHTAELPQATANPRRTTLVDLSQD
ncbi:hypothetical protein V1J52_25905 [Streptomyces sp. TRM 70351]|uniref:hypothetical protein n=1 Tax=Streptomyces sp. TRM 70351 TaxID=3116552 RepID=UPI002E7AF8B7|nr:hypothetical protein [Streptomyces sp. TRM 70351]MEE1931557.1 hypothetical protein [Streptomyces sp. TRM 70351]